MRPAADDPGIWRARSDRQQWRVQFDRHGFLVEPDHGEWKWGLELTAYGVDAARTRPRSPQVRVEAERLTYAWDALLDEWFVNGRDGLEHGFTLRNRPAGASGALSFDLSVRGTLRATVDAKGRDVTFVDGDGMQIVNYAGLTVTDANGRRAPARFEALEDKRLRLIVDDSTARYPLTIDPYAQQAYLKPSNTDAADMFGFSVAVSGDTVVVGAIGEDSLATGVNGDQTDNASVGFSGAAYVFVRSGAGWSQQAYLKASNTGIGDEFGYSVAISGDTVVVGAPFEDSSARGVNGDQADNGATNAGAAYVFVRSGTVWTQQAYLKASNTDRGDLFGYSVSVSSDSLVVGAVSEGSSAVGVNGNQADNGASGAGAAYVFARVGGTWTQQAYLKASNPGVDDEFGFSVSISGDTVVVGAPFEDSNAGGDVDSGAIDSGAAYVFARSGGIWSQQARLKASNIDVVDQFGYSVAISDDTIIVGAIGESSNAVGIDGDQTSNTAASSGAAYVFVRSGDAWRQEAYLKASNTNAGDQFGYSVALSGDTAVVGAISEDSSATGVDGDRLDDGAPNAGAAYVFVRSHGFWSQLAYLKSSNTGAGDQFGHSVAVSGHTVVVGATGEDSAASGVDADQSDNDASGAGAAYVFATSITDTDAPAIHCDAADAAWHGENVTLHCTAEDADSGLADASESAFDLKTSLPDNDEAPNVFTNSYQVCDRVGNCASTQVGGNKIDRRAPWVGINSPAAGSVVTIGQTLVASYACEDDGSGLASCAGAVPSGQPLDSGTVGARNFTVTATDNVGNVTTASAAYTVSYGICSSFRSDVARKAGSTYPVKIRLCDSSGASIASPDIQIRAVSVFFVSASTDGVLDDSGNANPDGNFRYENGQYMFNLSLKGFRPGRYGLRFVAGDDPTEHVIEFVVK